MNGRFLWILFLFYCVSFFEYSYGLNRFFKINSGIRIAVTALNINSRVPKNNSSIRFDFATGITSDIWLWRNFSIGLGILYQRKGALINDKTLLFHYISLPVLLKFYFLRKRLAISAGPIHNFLVNVNGKLSDPEVDLTKKNTNVYDLGMSIGMHYVFYEFKNGMQLISDLCFEFGLVNVYNNYRPEIFNRTLPYLSIGINFF